MTPSEALLWFFTSAQNPAVAPGPTLIVHIPDALWVTLFRHLNKNYTSLLS